MHDKATNLFIGSFLKLIYTEADYTKLEQWPTPWRQLYNWSSWGYWYNGPNLTFEEDSDLDFHILFLCLFLPIHLLCSLFILVLVYSSLFLCGAWTFFYEVIHPYTAILGVAFAFLQLFKILFSRRWYCLLLDGYSGCTLTLVCSSMMSGSRPWTSNNWESLVLFWLVQI